MKFSKAAEDLIDVQNPVILHAALVVSNSNNCRGKPRAVVNRLNIAKMSITLILV